MPLPLFEALCVAIIALTLFVMSRRTPPRELLVAYAALAAAGFLGEDSCIVFYRHYAYASGWHARIHHVPLLVPLIWPLVILSARSVVAALWPDAGRAARAVAVGLVVIVDASLVEVVAVRAGLWSWAEGGHLGVPVIGILGWGYFAAAAELVLSSARAGRHALLLPLAPLATHAMLIATWWGAFRWVLRGSLAPGSSVAVLVLGAAATVIAASARRAGRGIPLEVAAPRLIAASLFFALLLATAPADVPLWLHTAAVAIPYFVATALRASRSPAAPA